MITSTSIHLTREVWDNTKSQLNTLLRDHMAPNFRTSLYENIEAIASWAHQNSVLLARLAIEFDTKDIGTYSTVHALHCASICSLIAAKQGWGQEKTRGLIGAALTMNIGILELQDALAQRPDGPTVSERMLISQHPAIGAYMLRAAGIVDEQWLSAITQHHEDLDGNGYPSRMNNPIDLARILRHVDVFTAKHSPRSGRAALPALTIKNDLVNMASKDPEISSLFQGLYSESTRVPLWR